MSFSSEIRPPDQPLRPGSAPRDRMARRRRKKKDANDEPSSEDAPASPTPDVADPSASDTPDDDRGHRIDIRI